MVDHCRQKNSQNDPFDNDLFLGIQCLEFPFLHSIIFFFPLTSARLLSEKGEY